MLGVDSVRALARRALEAGDDLAATAERAGLGAPVDLDTVRLLPPIDHADPAHLMLSGTGLTHLGSAEGRDAMHRAAAADPAPTDSMRMFRMGVEGGKPAPGEAGVQPEWFYKGDGSGLVASGEPLVSPAFARDGGEEPEIAGIYLVDADGTPVRLGFALANEFSDHVTERGNYLWLAHSKLRPAALGPELWLGALPRTCAGPAASCATAPCSGRSRSSPGRRTCPTASPTWSGTTSNTHPSGAPATCTSTSSGPPPCRSATASRPGPATCSRSRPRRSRCPCATPWRPPRPPTRPCGCSEMANPIRIGLVGVGKIARDQHLPVIAASPDYSLVAVASRHGGLDGVPSYGSLEAMLAAHGDLDAVALCQPPQARFAAALAGIAAGRHVFLEKPRGRRWPRSGSWSRPPGPGA